MFDSMVAEPAGYMEYTLGYLEIEKLRETAEKELGDGFQVKEFHKFLLDVGEAPFAVIQDRMEKWMKQKEE